MGRPAAEEPERGAPELPTEVVSGGGRADRRSRRRGRTTLPLEMASAPRVTERFAGRALEGALETIREGLEGWLPAGTAAAGELMSWLCWRFSSASQQGIAGALEIGEEALERAVREVRGLRQSSPAWARQLRGLEWRIRWMLRSGPCRA